MLREVFEWIGKIVFTAWVAATIKKSKVVKVIGLGVVVAYIAAEVYDDRKERKMFEQRKEELKGKVIGFTSCKAA